MAEQNGTPTAPHTPDSIITTRRDGQTIVAELFFNHSGTETFRDKLLKVILADHLQDGQEPGKTLKNAPLSKQGCRKENVCEQGLPSGKRLPTFNLTRKPR